MSKAKQFTTPFNAADLRRFEQRLERVTRRLADIRQQVEEGELEPLYLFNSPSFALGVSNCERFSVAAELSLDASQRGEAYSDKTNKAALD